MIRFALPVLLALFLQTMYGAVDLLIVGQFGGELADVYVSAVSTGSQIMHTVTLVITGLSMGLTVYVGTKIGAGQRQEAGQIIGSGICLFGVIAALATLAMVLAAPLTARVMRAPEAAFSQTVSYITICSAGAAFIVAYNLVGSVFRGIGDSKMPLLTVAIACVFNIAGDLVLVAVFHMGASGAALATVFAQAVSVLLSLLIIRRRSLPFDFSLRDIRFKGVYVKQILRLGLPIALQDLLVNISFLVISMLKRVDVITFDIIQSAFTEGAFQGGATVEVGLSDEGVGYTCEQSNIAVSQEIIDQVEALKDEIIKGTLTIPTEKDAVDAFLAENQYHS